jgi:hypothetical protein
MGGIFDMREDVLVEENHSNVKAEMKQYAFFVLEWHDGIKSRCLKDFQREKCSLFLSVMTP